MNKALTGAILLAKPEGITSFQALSLLKRRLGTKKIGHTGTLDKFASGLLVVLVGSFTRLNAYITALDKEYEAIFRFGETTATLDPEGEVIARGTVPILAQIEEVLSSFCGEIVQRPPSFSAIHIDGKRAYERVLEGEVFEIPPRSVKVYSLKVLSYCEGNLKVRVHCSKGTYIRSLARDIAGALGTVAYVVQLERTRVGQFSLRQGVRAEKVNREVMIKPRSFCEQLGFVVQAVQNVEPFLGGKDIAVYLKKEKVELGQKGVLTLLDRCEEFVALVEQKEGVWRYLFVAPRL